MQSTLQIPDENMAVSVNLTDPARVAGLRQPGLPGGDLPDRHPTTPTGQPFTRLLLDRVTVLGVGSTTPVSTTTTDESGASDHRAAATHADDAGRRPRQQAQKVCYAAGNGELAFGLLTDKSSVR